MALFYVFTKIRLNYVTVLRMFCYIVTSARRKIYGISGCVGTTTATTAATTTTTTTKLTTSSLTSGQQSLYEFDTS